MVLRPQPINQLTTLTCGGSDFHALHRGDFSRLLRSRPIWDLFMLPLMLGVTIGAITGTWIGIRRLVRAIKYPAKYPLNQLPEFDPAPAKSTVLSSNKSG